MSCVFNSARSRIWLIWTAVGENMKLERLLLILGGGSPLWLVVFGVVYVCIGG